VAYLDLSDIDRLRADVERLRAKVSSEDAGKLVEIVTELLDWFMSLDTEIDDVRSRVNYLDHADD
jgi:hypothetical protein